MITVALVCGFALWGAAAGFFTPSLARRVSVDVPYPRSLMLACGAAANVAIAAAVGAQWLALAWLWLGGVGVVLVFIDIASHRLPDAFTVSSYPAIGLLLLIPTISANSWGSYVTAWACALASALAYFVLAVIKPGGIGLGDVKLAGILGLALGYIGIGFALVGFLVALVIGALTSIVMLLAGKAGRQSELPFGPAMLAAAVVALYVTVPFLSALLHR